MDFRFGVEAVVEDDLDLAEEVRRRPAMRTETKIAQGWPELWADFRELIGIFSQTVGPSLAIWANPVQFPFRGATICP